MTKEFWLETVFRPLVIAAMLGSIAISVVGLARIFFPDWNGLYLVGACILVSLEASYSRRLIRNRGIRGRERLYFRITEILTIFILLKAATYVGAGWREILADIRTWPRDPLNILNLEIYFAFGLVLISWDLTNQTMSELERVNERPRFRGLYIHPRQALAERYFLGGILLLFVAGLTQIGLGEIMNLDRPSVPGVFLNVLIYFLLGMVLLGQVRYEELHHRWRLEKITVAAELPRRWAVYSLVLISIGAGIAFFLPTGYTVGLFAIFDLVFQLFGIIAGVLWYAVILLFFLLMLPFYLLAQLLLGDEVEPPAMVRPPQLAPPPAAAGGSGGPAWFELLRSFIFWVIILGIIVYILRIYLQDHPEVREAIVNMWPLRMLRRLLGGLRIWFGAAAESVASRLPRDFGFQLWRGDNGAGRSFRFFRLGDLSPTERVRYYFLSVVKRAGEQGLPRRSSETPYEYKASLEQELHEARAEMAELTEAFVEARYSQHDIDRDELARITEDWKRVRAAIRDLKRRLAEADAERDAGTNMTT